MICCVLRKAFSSAVRENLLYSTKETISMTVTVIKIKDNVIVNWMLLTLIVSSSTVYNALKSAFVFFINLYTPLELFLYSLGETPTFLRKLKLK